jgi:hypothetical protein
MTQAIFPSSFSGSMPVKGTAVFKRGTNLTDAAAAPAPGTDVASEYVLPDGTLSQNRAATVGTGGAPATGLVSRFTLLDTSAFTYAVINGGVGGGTLFTKPAAVAMAVDIQFNGVDWILAGVSFIATSFNPP